MGAVLIFQIAVFAAIIWLATNWASHKHKTRREQKWADYKFAESVFEQLKAGTSRETIHKVWGDDYRTQSAFDAFYLGTDLHEALVERRARERSNV